MLEQAGVDFAAVSAEIDEDAQKALAADPAELAGTLASMKALEVSRLHEGWVIGSDSVASVDLRRFDKPATRDEAAEHLRFFSGKTLKLTSAAALARAGTVEWSHCDIARLSVRTLSEGFITAYLDLEWPEIGQCAGAFRLEGRGVQLFDAIDGSCFTILGMPLLPLLAALRDHGVIEP